MHPRKYQLKVIEAVCQALARRDSIQRHLMVEMPTGSGKSIVISALADRLVDHEILILTPRVKILKQLRTKLSPHGVLSGNLGNDLGDAHRVVIATPQTANRRCAKIAPRSLIIIDENHLVASGSEYERLLDNFPDAHVIGLTATPYQRNKHLNERGGNWETVYSISMRELIEQEHLVPPVSMATGVNSEIEKATAAQLPKITQRIVQRLLKGVVSNQRKKCLVFCLNIEHAKTVAALLNESGESNVQLVHSGQSQRYQDQGFRDFEESSGRAWLVNVGLVSIGVDFPCIDSIAIIRDVQSFALLAQMIGRGLRPFTGKVDCLIFDFGRGTERFGFIDDPDLGATRKPGALVPDAGLLTTCPACQRLSYRWAMVCRHCRAPQPRRTALREDAVTTPLLSTVGDAVYEDRTVTQDARGIWCVEHRLRRGGEALTAKQFMRSVPNLTDFPRRGRTVKVRPLAGNRVVILDGPR